MPRRGKCSAPVALVLGCALMADGSRVPPSPQPPAGAPGPGPWPNVLTGVIFGFEYKAHSRDFDRNNVTMYIENQGPTYWSMPRANIGDFAVRLSPKYPFSQDTLKDVQLLADEGIAETSPNSASTQAWRPSHRFGILVPSIRQNGMKWDDSDEVFYGTAGVCCCCSKGYGYSMLDGQWGYKEPHYNMDVLIGQAGARGEGVLDFSAAWFPFEQGWVGGWLDVPQWSGDHVAAKWREGAHSDSLSENLWGVVTWTESSGEATVKLPGVDSSKDGMLFIVPTDDENNLNVAGVAPGKRAGKGWLVQLRSDKDLASGALAPHAESDFAFLYLPFDTEGLIGGLVNGAKGRCEDLVRGLVTCERSAPGRYLVKLTHKLASDGMLILQGAGWAADGKNTKPAFLSYAPQDDSGTFIVEARTVQPGEGGKEIFPLTDTDFYFAWVDFRYAMGPQFRDNLRATCRTAAGTRIRTWGRYWWLTFFEGIFAAVAVLLIVRLVRARREWLRAVVEKIQSLRTRSAPLSVGREHSIADRYTDNFDQFAGNMSDDDDELFDGVDDGGRTTSARP